VYKFSWYVVQLFPFGNTCRCSAACGLLTAQNGNISDGSGSGSNYQNYAYCQWTIAPPGASIITLSFIELNTEPGTDVVTVYQCSSITCEQQKQLAELSGSYTMPVSVSSTTGYMKVVFFSGETITYDGFNALWTTVNLCILI
jgi:hypothetical protein